MRDRRDVYFAAAVGALVVVSRSIYAPQYLINFDAVNFALAIREFNPGLDQPQPPGYPVFVLLLRILDFALHNARLDLFLAGIVGSLAATLLLWRFVSVMYGKSAGYVSSLLLAVHPIFWYAGLANPVRTYLAVISVATAWMAWECVRADRPGRWIFGMAAVLGLLSGFRPETLVLMSPLFLWALLRARLSPSQAVSATFLLFACASAWIAPLAYSAGGPRAFVQLNSEYLWNNSRDFTLVFGAAPRQAFRTMQLATLWNFGPAVVWVWALLLAAPRLSSAMKEGRGLFLAVWFLPPFLFHALVHVRDLDQTLITAPVLCTLGGWSIVNVAVKRRKLIVPAAVTAVLLLSWHLFRRPVIADLKVASNGTVKFSNRWIKSTFTAIDALRAQGALLIVCHDSVVNWRQMSYYFPDTPVLYLPAAEAGNSHIAPFWALAGKPIRPADAPISLPAGTAIAWSTHDNSGIRETLARVTSVTEAGPLVAARPAGGQRFSFSGVISL